MARLLANGKLDNQLLSEQLPLIGSITSSYRKSTEKLSEREEFDRRRPSLPANFSQERQLGALRHQTSEPLLSQMNQKRELKLSKLFMVGNWAFSNLVLFQNLLCTLPFDEIVQFR